MLRGHHKLRKRTVVNLRVKFNAEVGEFAKHVLFRERVITKLTQNTKVFSGRNGPCVVGVKDSEGIDQFLFLVRDVFNVRLDLRGVLLQRFNTNPLNVVFDIAIVKVNQKRVILVLRGDSTRIVMAVSFPINEHPVSGLERWTRRTNGTG